MFRRRVGIGRLFDAAARARRTSARHPLTDGTKVLTPPHAAWIDVAGRVCDPPRKAFTVSDCGYVGLPAQAIDFPRMGLSCWDRQFV